MSRAMAALNGSQTRVRTQLGPPDEDGGKQDAREDVATTSLPRPIRQSIAVGPPRSDPSVTNTFIRISALFTAGRQFRCRRLVQHAPILARLVVELLLPQFKA